MTGFGDASEDAGGVHYSVEIRSLNSRYFKSLIRLPEDLGGLEPELDSHLRRRLGRGWVTLTARTVISDASAAHRVNDAALVAYLEHLDTLQARVSDRSKTVTIDLTALLTLPGVLVSSGEQLESHARPVLARLTDQACDRLIAMRGIEGRAIAKDLQDQEQCIRDRLGVVAARAPAVVEEYHQRLRARVNDLLARAELSLDEKDLIRDIAVFAERADISEETQRLSGHLDQFHQVIEASDEKPAGRTLDFVAQEMLREANTISSKSNDTQISRLIVEIKTAIDRIKEQVQNAE